MAGHGNRRVRLRPGLKLLRHPALVSLPLGLLAVGAGIGAQALLRPTPDPVDQELLAALIARPEERAAATPATATAAAAGREEAAAAAAIQARRASSGADGTALAEPEAGPELSLEIRVALLRLSSDPRLGATESWRLVDRAGRVLGQGAGDATASVRSQLAGQAEVWLEAGPGSQLLADDRPYAGRFRVLRGGDGLQVVNHLSLETYIASVVGAEMPSQWNIEALKAQAVAARSYAMAHMARPADDHWHLGDTTRWQAYQGLASVTPRTLEATAATAGVILSYQGGIVESLYAATQQISQEAHGHLGASMSQHGAQDLAQQGLRYNEILGRYYQGASLARLQAGAG